MKEHRAAHIHILAADEWGRRRARELYVHEARIMLAQARAMGDVPLAGLRRTFPDGTIIHVSAAEGDGPLVATITVLSPKEEKKKPPEEQHDYLWIGVRVCWEEMPGVGTAYPIFDFDFEYNTGFTRSDLDVLLEAPASGDDEPELCAPMRYFEFPQTSQDYLVDYVRPGVLLGFTTITWRRFLAGPYPLPPPAPPGSTASYDYDHEWRFRGPVYKQVNEAVPRPGVDPVGVAQVLVDSQMEDDWRALAPMPYRLNGTRPTIVYDFFVQSPPISTYSYDDSPVRSQAFLAQNWRMVTPSGNYPQTDLYNAPIVYTDNIVCYSAFCNPDVMSHAMRLDGMVTPQYTEFQPEIFNNDNDGWVQEDLDFPEGYPADYTPSPVLERDYGRLVGGTRGRNWQPTLRFSPHDSSPYDPMGGDDPAVHPWHVVFTIDPMPALPPCDERENTLLESRGLGSAMRGRIRPGHYTLHLARRLQNAGFSAQERVGAPPLIVEVGVMCGKLPWMVRRIQRFEVPVGEETLIDESGYDAENKHFRARYTMKLRINPRDRTIGAPEADDYEVEGEHAAIYTEWLSMAD